MSPENAYGYTARLIQAALRDRWHYTDFKVRLTDDEPPEIRIYWVDGPRPIKVRSLVSRIMQEALDKTVFRSLPPPRDITYKHTFGRPLRLAVREFAMAQVPNFDYITESGDYNPDSWALRDIYTLRLRIGDTDESEWLIADTPDRFVALIAYYLQVQAQGADPDGEFR